MSGRAYVACWMRGEAAAHFPHVAEEQRTRGHPHRGRRLRATGEDAKVGIPDIARKESIDRGDSARPAEFPGATAKSSNSSHTARDRPVQGVP